MATHALTYVYDDEDNVLCGYYKHFDGYPTSYGLELATFLSNITLVNGLNSNAKMFEVANGMDCLAAQLIVRFKDTVGDVYVAFPQTPNDNYDFAYHVFRDRIAVNDDTHLLFIGTWPEFVEYCKNYEDEE